MTFPGTAPAAPPTKPEPPRGVKILAGILMALVGVGCIAGVVGGAMYVFKGASSSKPASSPTSAAPKDRTFEAKWACEQFVKKQLKAPATAKFSDESSVKMSETEYTAAGSVDSQNSFGALLRNTFACDLTYNAATQEWASKTVSVSNN